MQMEKALPCTPGYFPPSSSTSTLPIPWFLSRGYLDSSFSNSYVSTIQNNLLWQCFANKFLNTISTILHIYLCLYKKFRDIFSTYLPREHNRPQCLPFQSDSDDVRATHFPKKDISRAKNITTFVAQITVILHFIRELNGRMK